MRPVLTRVGVFLELWPSGLELYDELEGLDWSWQSMDGAMTKAPLGGEKTGKNPTDRAKGGTKSSLLTEANGVPIGLTVGGANIRYEVLRHRRVSNGHRPCGPPLYR